MSRSTLLFELVPPFRLDLTVWTLRRRPDNAPSTGAAILQMA